MDIDKIMPCMILHVFTDRSKYSVTLWVILNSQHQTDSFSEIKLYIVRITVLYKNSYQKYSTPWWVRTYSVATVAPWFDVSTPWHPSTLSHECIQWTVKKVQNMHTVPVYVRYSEMYCTENFLHQQTQANTYLHTKQRYRQLLHTI